MYFGFPLAKEEINNLSIVVNGLLKRVSLWVCSAGIKTQFWVFTFAFILQSTFHYHIPVTHSPHLQLSNNEYLFPGQTPLTGDSVMHHFFS